MYNFQQDLTLQGAWRRLWDHPGTLLAKQVSRLIFKSVLPMFADLGWLWDSILIPFGSLLMPWQGPWGHPGAPQETDSKNHKRIIFGDLLFDHLFTIFSYFSDALFLCLFATSLLPASWCQNACKPQFRRFQGKPKSIKKRKKKERAKVKAKRHQMNALNPNPLAPAQSKRR